MSDPRVAKRTTRPPAVRTWEISRTAGLSGTTLWVHRIDGGKLELHYGGRDLDIPDDLVAAFGAAIAEAVAWTDDDTTVPPSGKDTDVI